MIVSLCKVKLLTYTNTKIRLWDFKKGLKLQKKTDTSGVAVFGFVELESVFVTVRQDGILDISLVSLPRNSISHHLVTFVK